MTQHTTSPREEKPTDPTPATSREGGNQAMGRVSRIGAASVVEIDDGQGSVPLPCIADRLAHQLRPDALPVLWAEVFAGQPSATLHLQIGAVLHRDTMAHPALDCLVTTNTQKLGGFHRPLEQCNSLARGESFGFEFLHGGILLDFPAMLDVLALSCKVTQETLVS